MEVYVYKRPLGAQTFELWALDCHSCDKWTWRWWRRRSLSVRVQQLCKRRGGRPGLPVTNSPCGLCGRKATLNANWHRSSHGPWPRHRHGQRSLLTGTRPCPGRKDSERSRVLKSDSVKYAIGGTRPSHNHKRLLDHYLFILILVERLISE